MIKPILLVVLILGIVGVCGYKLVNDLFLKPKDGKPAVMAPGLGRALGPVKDKEKDRGTLAAVEETFVSLVDVTLPCGPGELAPRRHYLRSDRCFYVVGELTPHGIVEDVRVPISGVSYAVVRCRGTAGVQWVILTPARDRVETEKTMRDRDATNLHGKTLAHNVDGV